MEIIYRKEEVYKLQTRVCQDFMKMMLKNNLNWKKDLYDIAYKAIKENKYGDNYIATYQKMRRKGFSKYDISDMDVSIIITIVSHCKGIVKAHKKTISAIEDLRKDRNLKSHSNYYEPDEQLYNLSLLALCDLQNFVNIVDTYEQNIDNEERLLFVQTYSNQIDDLKFTIDSERIDLLQPYIEMEREIKKILSMPGTEKRYRLWKQTLNEYWLSKKKNEMVDIFVIKASDAGVAEAHIEAADEFSLKEDYKETEKRIIMSFNSCKELYERIPDKLIDKIVRKIIFFPRNNNSLSKEFVNIIKYFNELTYYTPIYRDEMNELLNSQSD